MWKKSDRASGWKIPHLSGRRFVQDYNRISESRRGGLVANMLYKIDSAVYHLEVYGDKKKALLNEVETILDTVR